MANTGFGADFPNTEARQYPLVAVYQLGVNPADATAGAKIKLPPGAQVTGGLVNLTADTGGSISVVDNQASPVSLFGTIADGSGAVTGTTVSGGAGYTSAPAVAFSAPPAGGVQATGTANISGGVVTSITLTNAGSGYTAAPTVTFTGGGFTTAATATATVSVIAPLAATAITAFPYYPTGAVLTIAPTAATANVCVEYVIVGRCNESYLV